MRHLCLAAVLLCALAGVPGARAASSSGALSIIVTVPFAIGFSPSNPTEACEVPAGTVVSNLTLAGGDGQPAAWTLAGDTEDFALGSAASGLANTVVVGPNGIAAANCGKTDTVTVTATQP